MGLVGLALAAWWSGIGVKLDTKVQDQIAANKETIRGLEEFIADLTGSRETCIARCHFLYAEARFREKREACLAACEAGTTPESVREMKAEIACLKAENSRLRMQLLQLTERPRMSPSVFRIF